MNGLHRNGKANIDWRPTTSTLITLLLLLVLVEIVPLARAEDTLDNTDSQVPQTVDDYESNLQAQWDLWPYFQDPVKWHSEWTRWYASNATAKENFRAYRDFEPETSSKTIQRNTYIYNDPRGIVENCGRMCGPWELDRNDPLTSSAFGIVHPSRNYMRTINFPGRSAVWVTKDLPAVDAPNRQAGFELFLGDGESLRVSLGVVYDSSGELSQISAIREDSRDFGLFWSSTDDDSSSPPPLIKHDDDRVTKQDALSSVWFDGWEQSVEEIEISVPGLQVSQPNALRSTSIFRSLNDKTPWDKLTVFEVPSDGLFVVCPNRLPTQNDDEFYFELAVAWEKQDGTLTSALEVVYNENGTMSHAKYLSARFSNVDASEVVDSVVDSDAGSVANIDSTDFLAESAANCNRSNRWHGILVAMSIAIVAMPILAS